LHRVALEIEFDHDRWFIPDDPTIVSWFNRNRPRRGEFKRAPIGVLNMDLPACEKTDVRMLTQFCANEGLHVTRPAESRRVDHPLHPAAARASYVKVHTSNLAMLGCLHRCGQGIERHKNASAVIIVLHAAARLPCG
jgi:hypothetical protein